MSLIRNDYPIKPIVKFINTIAVRLDRFKAIFAACFN